MKKTLNLGEFASVLAAMGSVAWATKGENWQMNIVNEDGPTTNFDSASGGTKCEVTYFEAMFNRRIKKRPADWIEREIGIWVDNRMVISFVQIGPNKEVKINRFFKGAIIEVEE